MAKVRSTKPGGYHATGPGGLSPEAFARWYREQAVSQWEALDLAAVARLAEAVVLARDKGRRVYVMGNGGSAAAAAHWATDLSKTAGCAGERLVECVSLADNASYITAIGNDLSFDHIFSKQLDGLLRAKDLVILLSGSGNSANLLNAAALARKRKATVAALLGFNGGKLKALADIVVHVPSDQYGVIEDLHMSVGHILTFYLKQRRSR